MYKESKNCTIKHELRHNNDARLNKVYNLHKRSTIKADILENNPPLKLKMNCICEVEPQVLLNRICLSHYLFFL